MYPNGVALRFGLASLVLAGGIGGLLIGGWAIVAVVAIAMFVGGPVDEAAGDDETLAGDVGSGFYTANLYATAPLIALLTIAYLYTIPRTLAGNDGAGQALQISGGAFLVGYLYTLVGVTVAHELTHWTHDRIAQQAARLLLSFTFNSTFTIYHVHGHHRAVAQYDDAATARRGEHVFAFLVRTTIGQFREAFSYRIRSIAPGKSQRLVMAQSRTKWPTLFDWHSDRQLGDRRRSRDAGVSLRRFGRTGDSRTHELRPALRPCAGQRRASRTAAYLGLSPAHFQCLILQSPAAFASSYVCIEAVLESADQHRRTEAAARLSDDGAVSFSCSAMAPHNEPVALALGRQFRERGGAPVGPATGVGPTLFDAAAQHVASRPHIINILPACSLKAPMAVGSVEGRRLDVLFFPALDWETTVLTEISAADFRTAAMWAKQTAHRWSILWCAAVCVVALPVSCSFAQTSNAKSDAQVYLFRGFMNVFSLGMDGFEGELVRRGIRATTQNHLLWSIAADEAAQSYKQGHVRTIITMGHSLGAPAVISFVERLGALGVPVSLAVTLDGGTGTVSAARVRSLHKSLYIDWTRRACNQGTKISGYAFQCGFGEHA